MTKERDLMVGNLTKKIKSVKYPGVSTGGGGGMGTLGFDSYISDTQFSTYKGLKITFICFANRAQKVTWPGSEL